LITIDKCNVLNMTIAIINGFRGFILITFTYRARALKPLLLLGNN